METTEQIMKSGINNKGINPNIVLAIKTELIPAKGVTLYEMKLEAAKIALQRNETVTFVFNEERYSIHPVEITESFERTTDNPSKLVEGFSNALTKSGYIHNK